MKHSELIPGEWYLYFAGGLLKDGTVNSAVDLGTLVYRYQQGGEPERPTLPGEAVCPPMSGDGERANYCGPVMAPAGPDTLFKCSTPGAVNKARDAYVLELVTTARTLAAKTNTVLAKSATVLAETTAALAEREQVRALLREALVNLEEHDREHQHVTPPKLIKRINNVLASPN